MIREFPVQNEHQINPHSSDAEKHWSHTKSYDILTKDTQKQLNTSENNSKETSDA